MKTTIFNFTPRFNLAQESAYNILASSNIHELPVNLKKLIRSYNIQLQTYTQFAKDLNISLDMVISLCASNDGCIMKRNDGIYLLLYNDLIPYKGRIRFTLAHEFGHFILKHHDKTKDTLISRKNPFAKLNDKNYESFEQEANYFAKRLLVPIPLVNEYSTYFETPLSPKIVSEIFGTSKEVAGYIIQEINKRNKNISIKKETHFLLDNFKQFITQELYTKLCTHCNSISNLSSSFCNICGSNHFIKPTLNNFIQLHNLKRNSLMIYPKLKLDKDGRLAEKCPICENENLHDHYCQICGKDIINKCTGIKETNNGFLTPQKTCNTILEGDARYCYICGARSTFLENELLPPWKKQFKNVNDSKNKASKSTKTAG